MSNKIQPRDISPLLQKVRNFLLGREHLTALRFTDGIAARTQPPPNLPEGPAHILATNYYYARDGRREVKPPAILADQGRIAIASGEAAGGAEVAKKKPATPGNIWQWD